MPSLVQAPQPALLQPAPNSTSHNLLSTQASNSEAQANGEPEKRQGHAGGEEESEEVRAWLQRCLPVLVQPQHDIKLGHPVVAVFYDFREDPASAEILCELKIVYEGEASYRRLRPTEINEWATFFYMSFNRVAFQRTADINYLTMRGVNLTHHGPPWASIRTRDHCGTQTWSQGNKANLSDWLSLFHHYGADVPASSFQLLPGTSRPVVYVNTANHLMGERNANLELPQHNWTEYLVLRGGCEDAEQYARTMVAPKATLWNPWPNWWTGQKKDCACATQARVLKVTIPPTQGFTLP